MKKGSMKRLNSLMEKNGYVSTSEGGFYVYEKHKNSGQIQRVFVVIDPNLVTFQMELAPSSKYHHIEEEKVFDSDPEISGKVKYQQKYRTTEELQTILDSIAFSMEKVGFQYLDQAEEDPDDLHVTPEDDKDLYLHHEEYVENFKKQHHINSDDKDVLLQKIKEVLISLPAKPSQIDRKQLIQLAAVCGHIYILYGGKWEIWETRWNKLLCIKLRKKGSKLEDNVGNPLSWIFICVSNNQREIVEQRILKRLTAAGYL